MAQNRSITLPMYQAIAGCFALMLLLFYLGNINGKSSAKEYIYVDIERIVEAIGASLVSSDLHAEELSIRIDLYKQQFKKLLDDYSVSHNAIIFSKPKLISGASDRTDYFIRKLLGDKI